MTATDGLVCDGCGQTASQEHIVKRLQRLEWTTRYRPVHIQTLLLSDVSPTSEADFLYSPTASFQGEARSLLDLAGISPDGKPHDSVHAEFQRAGFFLTHVLECPLEKDQGGEATELLLGKRLPAVLARIRRSLKPRRTVLIGGRLNFLVEQLRAAQLECPVIADGNQAFILRGPAASAALVRLQTALANSPVAAR
jgi:hypothetical protein